MKRIFIYIAFILIAMDVMAQTEKQLSVSEIRQQTIIDEPITLEKGYFKVGSGLSYYFLSSERYDDKWNKVTNFDNSQTNSFYFPLNLRYGVTNNFEIDFATSLVNKSNFSGNKEVDNIKKTIKLFNEKEIRRGFSDINLWFNYRLLQEKGHVPSLALFINPCIPFGKTTTTYSPDSSKRYTPTTDDIYSLTGGYFLKKTFYPFAIVNTLSYTYFFPVTKKMQPSDISESTFKRGSFLYFSCAFDYLVCDWISLSSVFNYSHVCKLSYSNEMYKSLEVSSDYISWTPQLYLQIKNLRLIQMLDISIAGRNWSPSPSYMLVVEIKL